MRFMTRGMIGLGAVALQGHDLVDLVLDRFFPLLIRVAVGWGFVQHAVHRGGRLAALTGMGLVDDYPVSIILSGQRQLSWPVSCRCSLGLASPVLWGGCGRPWRGRARKGARRATERARPRQGRGAVPMGRCCAPRERARDDDYSTSGLTAGTAVSARRALPAPLGVGVVGGALPRWPRACLRR